MGKYSIESLRILNKSEFEWLFGQSNQAAKTLRLIENAFPKVTSGMSAYCLIDICKPAGDTVGMVSDPPTGPADKLSTRSINRAAEVLRL